VSVTLHQQRRLAGSVGVRGSHTGSIGEGYDEVRLLRPGQPLLLDDPALSLDVGAVLPPA